MPHATRGVKTLLKKSSPGKSGTVHGHRCYKTGDGKALRGITKLLNAKLFSNGAHLGEAIKGDGRGGCWRGPGGGRRRGRAVDTQMTRLVNGSKAARRGARMMKLTRLVFTTLRMHNLEPLVAQRVVHDGVIGTALDLVCQRGEDELVVMELKCGFAGDRDAPALLAGRVQTMAPPCAKAKDSVYNRHLAQLAVGFELFSRETQTVNRLSQKGITHLTGALMYVNNENSSLYPLPSYWQKRGKSLVDLLRTK